MEDKRVALPITGYDPSKDTRLNKLEAVVSDMQSKGYTMAGQAFLYGQRPKQEYTYVQPQLAPIPPNKNFLQSVGGFAGGIVKDAVKNTYTALANAGMIGAKFIQKEAFQLTHGGQDQFAFHGNNYNKLSDEYTQTKSRLSKEYKSGTISQSQYNQQLDELEKNVGVAMRAEESKLNALDKTYYQVVS